jgi:hypothetical protein
MQIQLNTDQRVARSPEILDYVEKSVCDDLRHVAEAISLVKVHLNDVNSAIPDESDTRCVMEARIPGRQPLSVECRATNIDLAVNGAASQLARSVKTSLAKSVSEGKESTDRLC